MAGRRRSAVSRKHRRASRKAGRRAASRKMMYGGRRSSCMMRGGNPAALSLAQGKEYAQIHAAQHGGAAVSLAAAAPVGYTGMLDDSLRATARVLPLDQSVSAIQGLSDQSGGGSKKRGRRGMTVRKLVGRANYLVRHPLKSTMKMTKAMKKAYRSAYKSAYKTVMRTRRRMMRGGAPLTPADYASPGMLLSPAMEAKALAGMNPEWKLAADPAAFAPKMY